MSDEIKRYPATPRRLERLRQAGLSPASAAVTAAVAIVAATGGLVLLGGRLCGWLAGLLAQDLQRPMVEATALPGLLATRLLQGGLAVVLVALGATAMAVMAHIAQGGGVQRSSKQMYLPMTQDAGASRPRFSVGSFWLGLLALCALAVLLRSWLQGLSAQTAWPDPRGLSGALALWWRWVAVLVAVAILHGVATRLSYLSPAQMSHREMLEDRRETEGSWLKRRRVNEWLQNRLRRRP